MDFTGLQAMAIALASATPGAILYYWKNGGMNDLVGILQDQAEKVTGEMRINADGSITISATTAPVFLDAYEQMEDITGKAIVNRKETGWIKAAESDIKIETGVVVATEPYTVVKPYRYMDEETFRFMVCGLPESEVPKVREQIDLAEKALLREYPVDTSRRVWLIRDGILAGDYDIWYTPPEVK